MLLEWWEDRHVRLLIASYTEYKHLFTKGKTTKKDIFVKIANAFNSKSDKMVTGDQCLRKWAKLELKTKEVEDHNKLTGRNKKSWKFQDEMTACIGSSPKINPAITIDTSDSTTLTKPSSGSSSSLSSPGDDTDNDRSDTDSSKDGLAKPKAKKIKQPTRKRKSNSSAAEMLRFLESYSERREKAEAEKLELLRSMKREKTGIFY